MSMVAALALDDGNSCPKIGLGGLWQIPGKDVQAVVSAAAAQGCRLIHWLCPGTDHHVESRKAKIDTQDDGRARLVDVSNFGAQNPSPVLGETCETPALSQINIEPRLQQAAMRAKNETRGGMTQSRTPLGNGFLIDAPAIHPIANPNAGACYGPDPMDFEQE